MNNKRALIVTLFKAHNFGAFLQAFALQNVLHSMGFTPYFLDFYGPKPFSRRFKENFTGWRNGLESILFHRKRRHAFQGAARHFRTHRNSVESGFDCAVFGSDEIWSVTNPGFMTSPELFGINVSAARKISYAPCTGDSSITDISMRPSYQKALCTFDAISVRDWTTYEVVRSLTARPDIELVLDPAFIYNFDKHEEEYRLPFRFLLIYTYGMPEERVGEIVEYAKCRGLRLVSPNFRHVWCDIQLPCTPFQFLSLVRHAEAVITDTYHGSVFAIKYKKDFVAYNRGKEKVNYLLRDLGLGASLIDGGGLSNQAVISTDYSKVEPVLLERIDSSLKYLECAVRSSE